MQHAELAEVLPALVVHDLAELAAVLDLTLRLFDHGLHVLTFPAVSITTSLPRPPHGFCPWTSTTCLVTPTISRVTSRA